MRGEPIILNTSNEAAQQVTAIGWMSRTGRFYGDDERMARWDGCTHIACACGEPVEKTWLACDACRRIKDAERWNSFPLVEWDGETPFFTFDSDNFFSDVDAFYEWCLDNEADPSSVRLVLAKPRKFAEVDSEYWCDDLPEDGDLPDDIAAAVEHLNTVIRAHKEPAAWWASNKRIIFKAEEK